MRDSGKYTAKCIQQRRRKRLLWVSQQCLCSLIKFVFSILFLKHRKTALAKSSTMTDEQKKKWMPCLVPDMMSSEESEDGDEEQTTFQVHPLPWRSDKVTAFIKKLDLIKSKNCTSQWSKRMAVKHSIGLPSDRLPPDSLSEWMVKKSN